MSLSVCIVRLVSMVVCFLQLLIVCLQSPCDEHRGCVLLDVEWDVESSVSDTSTCMHTP
jgi:hypothetical protein